MYERHCPHSIEEADEIYNRMFAVELASWKGVNDSGMAEPISKVFYDAMLKTIGWIGRCPHHNGAARGQGHWVHFWEHGRADLPGATIQF